MSTSLAEQLQRLRVPQTSLLKRDKKRASLLFDPKEAANLTRETVYQIGLDGLEELKQRNPAFSQFENTLFHVTSKDIERAVETVEGNQRLDKNIKKFLMLLSPHFLFSSSYKALEWLVCRYHIHEYNKEDLLMLILPYHETNIFVRVLQLLNFKEPNSKWVWLRPLQKPGVHLAKQTLYNHAASSTYFLECVSNYILTMIKEHEKPSSLTVIFNFYCTTFTAALEYSREVSEGHVSHMLPLLVKGLTSNVPDFVAASYVVVARLISKTDLSSKVLDKFVEKVSLIPVPNLYSEAVLVLTVLYQSQKQYQEFPEVAIRNLHSKDGFAKSLEKLNRDGVHIYPLVGPLFRSGVAAVLKNEENQTYVEFLDGLMQEVKFEDGFVSTIINIILDVFCTHHRGPATGVNWLKGLLNRIERQHPTAFDGAVKTVMTTTKKLSRIQHQKALRRLIQNIDSIQDSYELFEKLYHPSADIRVEGLKMLHRQFKFFKSKDADMVKNALFDRLNDESVEVVHETLTLFKLKFPQVVDMSELKVVLVKLLNKSQTSREWWEVSNVTLVLVCLYFSDSDVMVFLGVLPFLLPVTEHELAVAKRLLETDYAKTSKMLQPLLERLTSTSDPSEFSAIIYKNFEDGTNLPSLESVIETVHNLNETSVLQKYLIVLFLTSCLPRGCDVETSGLVLDIFEIYLENSKLVVKGETGLSDFVTIAKHGKFALQSFLYCIKILILKTDLSGALGNLDLTSSSSRFYVRILKILAKGSCSSKQLKAEQYRKVLSNFWERNENALARVELLLNVTICDSVSDDLKINCLRILAEMLAGDVNAKLVSFDGVFVPYLLIGLSLPNAEIRKKLLRVVETLNATPSTHYDYGKLFAGLLKYQEEILVDHEQLPVVMANILKDRKLKTILDSLIESLNKPHYPVYCKSGLIRVLSKINNKNIFTETSKAAVDILIAAQEELDAAEAEIIAKNILRFDAAIAKVADDSTLFWDFIKMAVTNDKVRVNGTVPAVLILKQITRELFSALKPKMQGVLLDLIVSTATFSQNADVLLVAAHVFKHIDLDTTLVLEQLTSMRDVQSPKNDPTKRKRRISVIPTVDILGTIQWRKGLTVLECIQDKKKLRNVTCLLGVLFEILKKCLDFDEQASVEYPKQLILSTILHICDKLIDETLPEKTFNMELVVQCIRASPNPQTHHHALLLLARAATLIPEQVLHHIIAVFTFVGSSVLRHDDAYSFEIITKIIDNIIPLLSGGADSIESVLRVFVDALLDVPEHRRLAIFKQLLTRLNAKENLHLFMLIVFESHTVHSSVEKRDKSKTGVGLKKLEIAADICREFAPDIVIASLLKIIVYMRQLPEEKPENKGQLVFDTTRCTAKQYRHYKYTVVTFTANFLCAVPFVSQVAALSDAEMLQLDGLFKDMIINILNYIQETSKVVEKHVNTPHAQYWKVILHFSYDILDGINALLTNQMFLLVIRGLMVYSIATVRKRALELLNNKLQHDSSFLNECDKEELYNTIVTSLINILKSVEKDEVEHEQELVVQKALISLKLLVKFMAPENPKRFVPVLHLINDLISLKKSVHENTLASLVLCLAELCSALRAHAIASLPHFMPVLIKILKGKNLEAPSLLLVSDITAIQKILDTLPLFLSPYLGKLLYGVSSLACKWSTADHKSANFIAKLQAVQQKIGSVIPLRVILPAIEDCYNTMLEKGNFAAIGPLMSILSENLKQLKESEIQAQLQGLTAFFLHALQFRADERCSERAVEVESYVVKALVSLILKLSESTFRPLYYKLFDWAVRTDAKTERVITFYNLSSVLAKQLKGLFVLFAGHFLNNAASLLNVLKSDVLQHFEKREKNVELLENILNTLREVFTYDNQKFVTKDRFEVLMRPIVDQLENDLGGMESLEKRAKEIVTPCIVQFAVATADDALWKQMNYQILLKMRHGSSVVRLVGLDSFRETAKKLGEDFLPLLPESIPFLAELMEDEDETVEQACKKAVQELEKVLGEPLQKYF